MTKQAKKRVHQSPARLAFLIVSGLIILGLAILIVTRGNTLALLQPAGTIANQQTGLLFFTVGLGMFVLVPVFVLLFSFAIRYRAGHNHSYTPEVEGNRVIETLWWLIPILIITVLSVVTWKTTHDLDPLRPLVSTTKPLTVQVVSMQWRWLFLYPDLEVASINELRIPEKTPINFQITGDSPMSAFWVPQLGSQIYAMNGMISRLSLDANRTGTFHGSNSNISGEGYSNMDFDVISMNSTDFSSWSQRTVASSKALDWKLYKQLAEPSKDSAVKYYALTDSNLLNKVTGQYTIHGTTNGSIPMTHQGESH